MTQKTLAEWLSYFDEGARGRVHLGLDRVKTAAEKLDLLPVSYPNVIVGGTNGKGSTSTCIAKILEASNDRVGLYTSPHVLRYNERIVINSQPVSDEALCQAFEIIDQSCFDIFLSYFEVGLLACLWIFKKENVSVAVFEVGLGGRLDAVNIVDADVSVITTVDFDHMAFLGNSLEEIAYEKSGIMRNHKPSVYGGDYLPLILQERALDLQVPLFVFQHDFKMKDEAQTWKFSFQGETLHLPKSSMHPSNMACVIVALRCLSSKVRVNTPAILETFKTIQVLGRYQRYQRVCPWILDVAHNVQAVRYLVQRLQQEPVRGKKKAIFCCMADKNIQGMMLSFCPHVDILYIVPLAIPRAAKPEELLDHFERGKGSYPKTQVKVLPSVAEAVNQADLSAPEDCVIVFGSFYLLEAIMGSLSKMS